MEKRQERRVRRGIQCEIRTPGSCATGLVENVSARGLFVKTAARLPPNRVVEVLLSGFGERGGLRIEAGVARTLAGSRRFESQSESGLGLQVIPPGRPSNDGR